MELDLWKQKKPNIRITKIWEGIISQHNTIGNNPYFFLNGGVNVKIVFMWKLSFSHEYNCQWF
jgi:hypothetical protein